MNCIIWGGTGQAKVVRPILESLGHQVIAVFDNNVRLASPFSDIPLVGGLSAFTEFRKEFPGEMGFVVAVGGTAGVDRVELSRTLQDAGLEPISAIHHRAFVADTARVGAGAQIMAMATVSEFAEIGDCCIINTNSSVDHDCSVGRGVHIMPGATLAGSVTVGEFASIGTNATILPRIRIGARAIVGAGAVVTRDVADDVTVVGTPARALGAADAAATTRVDPPHRG